MSSFLARYLLSDWIGWYRSYLWSTKGCRTWYGIFCYLPYICVKISHLPTGQTCLFDWQVNIEVINKKRIFCLSNKPFTIENMQFSYLPFSCNSYKSMCNQIQSDLHSPLAKCRKVLKIYALFFGFPLQADPPWLTFKWPKRREQIKAVFLMYYTMGFQVPGHKLSCIYLLFV